MITRPIRKTFTITTSHERLGVTGELDMTRTPSKIFAFCKWSLIIAAAMVIWYFAAAIVMVIGFVAFVGLLLFAHRHHNQTDNDEEYDYSGTGSWGYGGYHKGY